MSMHLIRMYIFTDQSVDGLQAEWLRVELYVVKHCKVQLGAWVGR